jgi:hypothetical protein
LTTCCRKSVRVADWTAPIAASRRPAIPRLRKTAQFRRSDAAALIDFTRAPARLTPPKSARCPGAAQAIRALDAARAIDAWRLCDTIRDNILNDFIADVRWNRYHASVISLTDFAVMLPLVLVLARVLGLSGRACGAARLIDVASPLASITRLNILFGARGAARRGGASTMNFGRSG